MTASEIAPEPTLHLFLVGAGPVGLVTAVGFARLGHRVTVADIDGARVAGLREGRAPFFEPGLDDAISDVARQGNLDFTTDPEPPADAPFSIVCVGTPTGAEGPLSMAQVEEVVRGLLGSVAPEHVVVVRSTLPVDGPSRLQALVSAREAAAGRSATVVTNPEFMREGAGLADFDRPNRVVTGWLRPQDEAAARAAAALYEPLAAPTLVADARSVAIIKLASNVFLATKIAFANELARLCDLADADVDLVATGIGLDDRIGRAFLSAGPGYGGSCLPEQAIALARHAESLGMTAPLIAAVSRSNGTHQRAIVARLDQLLREHPSAAGLAGSRIALLGLAFKAGTDDVRESPALALASHLREGGAAVVAYDPRASRSARRADPALTTADDPAGAARGARAVLVATEWPEFRDLAWQGLAAVMAGDLVYDTRGIVDRAAVRAAGLRCEILGRR
jgi:UDPglucose 6-dehydrogenase